jgi:hypothetical protein
MIEALFLITNIRTVRQKALERSVRAQCSSGLYSNRSPGWHSKALQMDSKVLNRTAFAFPVFRIDKFARVRSTFSESSFNDILRFAIITSRFTMIAMAYTVRSFSAWISIPRLKTWAMIKMIPASSRNSSPPPKKSFKSGISTPRLMSHSE